MPLGLYFHDPSHSEAAQALRSGGMWDAEVLWVGVLLRSHLRALVGTLFYAHS
jgi:hypothetical protein